MIKFTTLWDIMKAINPQFLLGVGKISGLAILDAAGRPGEKLSSNERQDCLGLLKFVLNELQRLELSYSLKAAKRIVALLSRREPVRVEDYNRMTEELYGRLVDEMKERQYFSIERTNQRFVADINLFGDEVANKFPSATFDIEEAGKCLAFERGSACVFHLMKALEVGLYSLASDLNIAKIEENWANAIGQIDKAIKGFENNKPDKAASSKEKSEWKDKVQFYSDCATQFRYIKDAWRNQNTHTRRGTLPYTSEKTRQIYDNVCDFMQSMATRLSEKV